MDTLRTAAAPGRPPQASSTAQGAMVTTDADPLETVLPALRSSHARLAAVAGPLTADEVTDASYCDEWTTAQVLSHLGSGAEIFGMLLDAGLRGEDTPGPDQYQEIWSRWNGKSPQDQTRDGIAADGAFLDRLGGLDLAARGTWPKCASANTPCTPGTSRWHGTIRPPCPRTPWS